MARLKLGMRLGHGKHALWLWPAAWAFVPGSMAWLPYELFSTFAAVFFLLSLMPASQDELEEQETEAQRVMEIGPSPRGFWRLWRRHESSLRKGSPDQLLAGRIVYSARVGASCLALACVVPAADLADSAWAAWSIKTRDHKAVRVDCPSKAVEGTSGEAEALKGLGLRRTSSRPSRAYPYPCLELISSNETAFESQDERLSAYLRDRPWDAYMAWGQGVVKPELFGRDAQKLRKVIESLNEAFPKDSPQKLSFWSSVSPLGRFYLSRITISVPKPCCSKKNGDSSGSER